MKDSLKQDVLNQCGSIHIMNAPHAIGYLFNSNKAGDEIANGMYCDRFDEIDHSSWEYFVPFKHIDKPGFKATKGMIYEIKPDNSLKKREMLV